jgi:microcompartment protein CcmK/EutM
MYVMRIGKVIGTVTLSRRLNELAGGRFLVIAPESAEAIRDGTPPTSESIVAYDEISAGRGSRVAFTEGREAAMPFHPAPAPVDAYCAAILDDVQMEPATSRKGEQP